MFLRGELYTLDIKSTHKSINELKIVFIICFFIILFSLMMLAASITGNYILNIFSIYLLTLSDIWSFIFFSDTPGLLKKR